MKQAKIHPALCVSEAERKAQIQKISTLRAQPLARYIRAQKVLSAAAQRRLLESPRSSVRTELAGHPSLLAEHQPTLARDYNQYVRRALAENPALIEEAARLLLDDVAGNRAPGSHPFIIENLASNRAVPLEMLREIHAMDPPNTKMTLLHLLVNPRLPLADFPPLEELSDHEQYAVAKRKGLTREELLRLRAKNVHPTHLEPHAGVWAPMALELQKGFSGTVGELLELIEGQIAHLSEAGQETVKKLYPDWVGSLAELIAAAKHL